MKRVYPLKNKTWHCSMPHYHQEDTYPLNYIYRNIPLIWHLYIYNNWTDKELRSSNFIRRYSSQKQTTVYTLNQHYL